MVFKENRVYPLALIFLLKFYSERHFNHYFEFENEVIPVKGSMLPKVWAGFSEQTPWNKTGSSRCHKNRQMCKGALCDEIREQRPRSPLTWWGKGTRNWHWPVPSTVRSHLILDSCFLTVVMKSTENLWIQTSTSQQSFLQWWKYCLLLYSIW